jgi:16S rRNA (uracil1498-N3)-methyltransferase
MRPDDAVAALLLPGNNFAFLLLGHMPVHDFTSQRLFVDAALRVGASIACSPEQANYLGNVLRMKDGDAILVFNGRDGEWSARLVPRGKRKLDLEVVAQTRAQLGGPDIDYLFAPLKRSRLDYMVQKATEMGVARLRPVITRHTQAERVNTERMRANAIEAAEQCGILRIPQVDEPVKLGRALETWDPSRRLIFCDELAEVSHPIDALVALRPSAPLGKAGEARAPCLPLAVLIGPEGGFSPEERTKLNALPFTLPLSLGPRIMRADTAAVAALALVNAVLGDWRCD